MAFPLTLRTYRPNAVITFIRPKDKKESPYLARFIVPLTFNKLDIRDYLWHAYGVAVVSVGSMVMGQGLEKKGSILMSARRTFRPAAKKMMICKLEEPFVWPARQVGDELPEPFEWFRYKHNVKVEEQQEQVQGMLKAGEIELFTQKEEVRGRDALRQEAQALLDGKKEWKNEVTLDPRWEGIDAVENDGGRKKL